MYCGFTALKFGVVCYAPKLNTILLTLLQSSVNLLPCSWKPLHPFRISLSFRTKIGCHISRKSFRNCFLPQGGLAPISTWSPCSHPQHFTLIHSAIYHPFLYYQLHHPTWGTKEAEDLKITEHMIILKHTIYWKRTDFDMLSGQCCFVS